MIACLLPRPELYFAGVIKLAQVTRVEIGNPGDFVRMLVCHPVKDFVTALRPDIAK